MNKVKEVCIQYIYRYTMLHAVCSVNTKHIHTSTSIKELTHRSTSRMSQLRNPIYCYESKTVRFGTVQPLACWAHTPNIHIGILVPSQCSVLRCVKTLHLYLHEMLNSCCGMRARLNSPFMFCSGDCWQRVIMFVYVYDVYVHCALWNVKILAQAACLRLVFIILFISPL